MVKKYRVFLIISALFFAAYMVHSISLLIDGESVIIQDVIPVIIYFMCGLLLLVDKKRILITVSFGISFLYETIELIRTIGILSDMTGLGFGEVFKLARRVIIVRLLPLFCAFILFLCCLLLSSSEKKPKIKVPMYIAVGICALAALYGIIIYFMDGAAILSWTFVSFACMFAAMSCYSKDERNNQAKTTTSSCSQEQSVPEQKIVGTGEQLLSYKKLFDMGAITAEEFAAKKKELLGLSEAQPAPVSVSDDMIPGGTIINEGE